VTEFEVVDYKFVSWIPTPACPYYEGIQIHGIPSFFVVVCDGGIFSLFLMPCCLESSVSVFNRHSNIYNGYGFASLIYSDKVWAEGVVRAWIAWLTLMVVEAEA
jgi:hypothetical protein